MNGEIESQEVLFRDEALGMTMNQEREDMVVIDKPEIENYLLKNVLNKVILGNALEILKKLPEGSVDMVFMDPPYFLQLPNKKLIRWKVKTEVDAVHDDWDKFASFEDYDDFITNILTEIKRVMKPNATIWVIATYHSIFRIGKVGANVWVLPLCNGKERLKDKNGKKLHSTQKPIELLRRVILTSTKEEDVILDPVAGVGTTGYVAKALNRDFIMIEMNQKYVEGIKKRFQHPLKIQSAPSKKQQKKIAEYMNLGD